MNIENLQYFICLVETLNFTKAAQRCHIAQTAMSRYISGLEKNLGVRLFERDKRNVRLTKAGRQFYEDAVRIQEQYRTMIYNVKHAEKNEKRTLSLGFGLYEFSRLSQALSEFFQFHPEIQLKIHQYNYGDLVEKFKKKELDMMVGLEICRNFLSENELEMRYLFSSCNSLVMSRQKAERYAGAAVA
ncbi:MAG TPA: LysR family transcriptional regulator [Candidatus Ventrisoma faecale]|nr:LysR family transcriptional regulator [Candidatus Ventrisoma faecale]